MRSLKRAAKGQSTAEYAIVIALVLGALVGMQTYVRRAMNARIADATDSRFPLETAGGAGTDRNGDGQPDFNRTAFEPYYATSNMKTTSTIRTAGPGGSGAIQIRNTAGSGPSTVQGTTTSVTARECVTGKNCQEETAPVN
jgi:hypothetical protein